ncbi:hypothetical protein, partial [Escherichia coli]|uniref:hypothetical protein n=1 Tax=Escherichia coli TaxID=562 RepID=UPI001BFECA8A
YEGISQHQVASQKLCYPIRNDSLCSKIKQKMSNTRHLGRKLDDSLPDFATIVVSRCRKWGKRDAL